MRNLLILLTLLSLLLLQGCIILPYPTFDSGLKTDDPVVDPDTKQVTLHWEPKVKRVMSRLPGGYSGPAPLNARADIDKEGKITDLSYDLELYRKMENSGQTKADNRDVSRELAYRKIYAKQGIRETQYTVPIKLENNATYAWRVRPVYRYKDSLVAEDWTRVNSGWVFAIINGGGSTVTRTLPPEFEVEIE